MTERVAGPRILFGPAISAVSVAAFFPLWYAAARFGWASPLIVPPPGEVLATALQMLSDGYRHVPLWQHVAISLGRARLSGMTQR